MERGDRIRRATAAMAVLALSGGLAGQMVWEAPTGSGSGADSGAVLFYDGEKVLTFGGRRSHTRADGGFLSWTGTAWQAMRVRNLPVPRFLHCVADNLSGGPVLLFGGRPAAGGPDLADTWEWDGRAWHERTVSVAPGPRVGAAMAHDPVRGRTVLFGGRSGGILGDTWEWDGTRWHRMQPGTSPSPRHGHTLAWHPACGRVVLFGGTSGFHRNDDLWAWNGSEWRELPRATRPPARSDHDLVPVLAPGYGVLLCGGGDRQRSFADTWFDNGHHWQRLRADHPGLGRIQGSMAADFRTGEVVRLGGANDGGGVPLETWVWDGSDWSAAHGADRPGPRTGASMADWKGRQWLFGGFDGGRLRGTFHSTGGGAWRPEPSGPPARRDAVLCATSTGLLLYGGLGDRLPLDDAWWWDGARWSALPAGPPARTRAAAAYDPHRDVVVVFGGRDLQEIAMGDTWEWDGVRWDARPGNAPSPRAECAMAWDGERGVIVLQGGRARDGTLLADTWEYDGTWHAMPPDPAKDPVLTDHRGVWDAERGRVVLVGGRGDLARPNADVWERVAGGWRRRVAGTGPVRWGHSAAWDPGTADVVVHGGTDGGRIHHTTWRYRNAARPLLASLGGGCAGGGTPELAAAGTLPWIGSSFRWRLRGIAPGTPAFLLLGGRLEGRIPLPTMGTGTGTSLCSLGILPEEFLAGTIEQNGVSWEVRIADDPAMVGLSFYQQALVADPGTPGGWALSNTLHEVVGAR